MKLRVLVACEFSGIVRDAFAARGHDAWSCDLLETESPGFGVKHYQGDVLNHLREGWDLMIAHPPCTFLALCQAWRKHPSKADAKKYGLNPKDTTWRREQRDKAIIFAKELWNAPIKQICLENPKSILTTWMAKKSQTIHPWQFGHREMKETWLWLKNLPSLKPTNNVYDEMMKLSRKERERVHYASPGENRMKDRSRTYQGVADAMAAQWSEDLTK
jgi:hypothetical protein